MLDAPRRASSLPDSELLLTLVHRADALLTTASDHSRSVAERKLADAGVNIVLNTEVTKVESDSLRLRSRGSRADAHADATGGGADAAGGEAGGGEAGGSGRAAKAARAVMAASEGAYDLPVDLTLWTAGSEPSAVVEALKLPMDERGRISVDTSLRVLGKPRLYALGDSSAVDDARGARAPSTAQAAMQQADYAAWNVRASLRSGPALPFRYIPLGEMLSLGDDAASISALGQLVKLSGPLAFAGRRAVYAARMPTPKQAAKVGLSWAIDAAFSVARKVVEPPGKRGP